MANSDGIIIKGFIIAIMLLLILLGALGEIPHPELLLGYTAIPFFSRLILLAIGIGVILLILFSSKIYSDEK